MSLLLNILDKLPGAYSKDPDSNIGRLFQLFAAALSGVEEALQTVALWRDLDSARGATLDRIGANFGIARDGVSDGLYRLLIKTKVTALLAGGDVDTIITTISVLFNVDPSQVDLAEAFPAKIRITVDETEMPHEHMALSGNATSVVKRIAAAGIGCEVIFYIPIGCELHAGLTLHDTSAEQYGISDAAESE